MNSRLQSDLFAPAMLAIQFHIQGEFIELNKLLKATSVCESGGAAGALITSGAVLVDGQVELRKGCKLRIGQVVEAAGTLIHLVTPELGNHKA